MKRLYFLFISIIVLFSCKHDAISDIYVPKYTSRQLQNRLEKYFKINSLDSVEKFLIEWNKEIPPCVDPIINQNDITRNIYQVFNDLYKLHKFGDYDVEKYFSSKSKFIVIQNTVNYSVLSNNQYQTYLKYLSKGFPSDSALKFYKSKSKVIELRPKLSIDSIKYLYLTKEYRVAINNFLLSDYLGNDSVNKMQIFYDDPKIYPKYEFLSPLLQLVHAHGGQNWFIETFPIVYEIVFDEKYQHGLVNFRAGFGRIVKNYGISKINGHWKADKNRIIRMIQE